MTAASVTPIRPSKTGPKPAKGRRKGKRAAAWPSRSTWPAPPPLRPIPWGKPDDDLAALVCRSVELTTPGEAWKWQPRRAATHPALGWFAVILICASILAGFRG